MGRIRIVGARRADQLRGQVRARGAHHPASRRRVAGRRWASRRAPRGARRRARRLPRRDAAGGGRLMGELRGLLRYFRPYRRALSWGIVSILMSVVIGMASPLLVGHAVDSFKTAPSMRTMAMYAGLLVLVAAGR